MGEDWSGAQVLSLIVQSVITQHNIVAGAWEPALVQLSVALFPTIQLLMPVVDFFVLALSAIAPSVETQRARGGEDYMVVRGQSLIVPLSITLLNMVVGWAISMVQLLIAIL